MTMNATQNYSGAGPAGGYDPTDSDASDGHGFGSGAGGNGCGGAAGTPDGHESVVRSGGPTFQASPVQGERP